MTSKLAVYIRHRLDVSGRDLLFGLAACVRSPDRSDVAENILHTCSLKDDGLVCLSVRTGFDLLLRALNWPAGEEVIVSAITHPDMIRIIQAHGLRAVPVDVDLETLASSVSSLKAALTPRTKGVFVAHLFGGKMDLEDVLRFVEEQDLLLIEDCAQAFQGPDNLGDKSSNVSMYSFGPLKTATALGGAVLSVNDTKLLAKMRFIEQSYPAQGRGEYELKLLKYLALILISRPIPYGLLVRVCSVFRIDLDALVSAMSRSFPPVAQSQFLQGIRRRPCVPLLSLLNRRLLGFDYKRLARRASVGERAARMLEPYIELPGLRSQRRTHWIFPVVSPSPGVLVRALKRHGFDASYATSNLVAVEAPSSCASPGEADRIMSGVVFLPVYPELPEEALDLLTAVITKATA
ncbi:MAG: aminotransferase class I/II-fold pyridoxal phosphate-dependent enzyme [Rubrobacteraceae bacterium]